MSRECNAGYVKNSAGTGCELCQSGLTYRDASKNVFREGETNTCFTCLACTSGTNYQSGACTTTVNRACTPCSTSCARGSWKAVACTITGNLQCTPCAGACPIGKYKMAVVCDGTTAYDAFLAACKPCQTPEDCGAGKYVSRVCPGTDSNPNQCVLCSAVPVTGDCPANQWRGGCANYTDTRCMAFTQCPAGRYLAGESRTQNGVCQACTNCSTLGLVTLRNCSTYDDAVCQGAACNRSVPCGTPVALANRSRLYCDYYTQGEPRAFCGLCPSGYGSDGQFCVDCPRGSSCNRLGGIECKGQCAGGFTPVCDVDFTGGYASCDQRCAIPAAGTGGRWVRRGTHVRPDAGQCETYFQCGAGYVKLFRSGGVVECEGCMANLLPSQQLARFVTEGLSVNDNRSCLWECKPELARFNALRDFCELLPSRDVVTLTNAAGQWMDARTKTGGSCPNGMTSEERTALSVGECVRCHALPSGAKWVGGSSQCDWVCNQAFGTLSQRGGMCVAPVQTCSGMQGYTGGHGTSVCLTTSFPWNRPGQQKLGWSLPTVVDGAPNEGLRVSSALQDGLAMSTLGYGVAGRHQLLVEGRGPNGTGTGAWYVQGPLCSAARGWVGRNEYIFGAVCNQSYLVFLNLSRASGAGNGYGVLIGNSTPGWRDGFRTQALFESELYVVSGGRNDTLFVLDRWNCLLREVVLYGEPGGYLTRVYTVWGSKDKLGLPVPEAKCYGPGSLSWPRRFWALRDGWVVFADDNGLWQFNLATRELVSMIRETEGAFEADELLDVDATDQFTLRLVFPATTWYVRALEAVCPDDSTSLAGSDCAVDCAWLSSSLTPARYVNRSTGLCVACSDLVCGYGEEFVWCTREADAYCRGCGRGGVYSRAGTCEDSAWRKEGPPCSVGSYAAGGGRYCEACPDLTTTWLANATDARQCKCLDGLVRRYGGCVGEFLYEFEVACSNRAQCVVPPNARLVPGDLVGCKYECVTGFYHRVGAGWRDKCSPCLFASLSMVAMTRGDDDEPWSCEWR